MHPHPEFSLPLPPAPPLPLASSSVSPSPSSSLASPRSSTSSSEGPSTIPPLTPLFDDTPGESTPTEGLLHPSSPSKSSPALDQEDTTPLFPATSSSPSYKAPASTSSQQQTALFGAYTFPYSSSAPPRSPSPALPTEGFTFGTCQAEPLLSTPTAELGPFDYPSSSSSSAHPYPLPPSSSPRRASGSSIHSSFSGTGRRPSLALGDTFRRASIVSRDSSSSTVTRRPSLAPHPLPSSTFLSAASPPQSRRSSTCSTLPQPLTLGRRPSILHSSTHPLVATTATTSPSSSRRPSLAFPPKALPVQVPPSLLARRGSLPAAQLFGLPTSERGTGGRLSLSGYPGAPPGHFATTAADLYARRDSLGAGAGARRGSMPHTSPLIPPSSSSSSASPRRNQMPGRASLPTPRGSRGSLLGSLRGMSLSSSEEDEAEEGEAERRSAAPAAVGFRDPWARHSVDSGSAAEGGGGGGGPGHHRAFRPALHTVESGDSGDTL